ncbi:MAG: UrcA family protein [Steroidobacteraceae bacterium]
MTHLDHCKRIALRPILAGMVASVALLGTLSSQASPADAAQARPRVAVRYVTEELTTERGVKVLYARLKNAALEVCPGADDRDVGRAAPARACYDAALADAVAQVRLPRLTAMHDRESSHAG